MFTKEHILELLDEHRVQFIDLWFTDITGAVKSMTVPVAKIEQVIERGTHFDGSSLDGFARVAESDMVLMPDLNTFTLLPWSSPEDRVARLICTVYTPQGEPFIGDPRNVLVKAVKQAEQMGFVFMTGMELEFFLFNIDANNRPIMSSVHDPSSYFDMSNDQAQVIRRKMLSTLDGMGIGVDSTHSEIGYGQHEIDLRYADAVTSADHVLTARVAMKTVAQHHRLHCTFMPRPSADLPGSGMHTHQTLHDIHTGKNIFVDASHEYGMSEIARHFLAGQLCHARAMCAVLAPLVNSYKRLGTSVEAPVTVTWAHINRAALIRVPSVSPGMEAHTRLELRCPDPSSNPYLASALMLMAGLDGIRQRMPLPDPLEETLLTPSRPRRRQMETLPTTLGEALELLEQDDTMMAALGPYISDRYLAAKRQEYEQYERQVTGWEVDRYISRY
jgi:glutamine synthetase